MAEIHDDPLREAGTAIVGICNELANVVMATQSLQLRLIGLKPDKDAPLDDVAAGADELDLTDAQAVQASSRFAWQPAMNDEWLAQASAVETAQAWAAAVPFADLDPSAAEAMARTEARLDEIHPEAMDHYRQLRASGEDPGDAMRMVAYEFDTPSPNARFVTEPAATASASAGARPSATMTLAKDIGLDDPAVGLHTHHRASTATLDQDLAAPDRATRSGVETEDHVELFGDFEESATLTQGPAGPVESAPSEDVALAAAGTPAEAAAGTEVDPAIAEAGPEGPAPLPTNEADRASELAHRAFPKAHEAAEKAPSVQGVTSRPPKRKALGKMLRRGGRG
jgi:hypothetical protein